MLEQCPHCSAKVLFINEYCPNCNKSKRAGQICPTFGATSPSPASSNSSSRPRSVVLALLLFAGAGAGFWYAHHYRNEPRYTIVGEKILQVSAQKMADYLLLLVTPDTNNMAHWSLLPQYKEAKQEAGKRRNIALAVQGGSALCALGGVASLRGAIRQRKGVGEHTA